MQVTSQSGENDLDTFMQMKSTVVEVEILFWQKIFVDLFRSF